MHGATIKICRFKFMKIYSLALQSSAIQHYAVDQTSAAIKYHHNVFNLILPQSEFEDGGTWEP